MKYAGLGALMLWGIAAWTLQDRTNVNSRYTVDKVELKSANESRLSEGLRRDLHRRIGKRYDQKAFAELAARVQKELRAASVKQSLTRGARRGQVTVSLKVFRRPAELTYLARAFPAASPGRANQVVTTLRYHLQLANPETNRSLLGAG